MTSVIFPDDGAGSPRSVENGMRSGTSARDGPLRVVVVDDDPMARRALREALTRNPAMTVAGEAASGASAEDAVREAHADVVVIDADTPDVDGVTATRRL